MNVGTLIRRSRKEQKLTLKVDAEKASISDIFLSQVANDVNSTSVDTLVRICNAIGIDADNLITQTSKQILINQKSEWDDIDLSYIGFVTGRFFAPEDRKVIVASVLILESCGKSIPAIKNGLEVLCALKGSFDLMPGDETYTFFEGDSVHFLYNLSSQMITNKSASIIFVLLVGTT